MAPSTKRSGRNAEFGGPPRRGKGASALARARGGARHRKVLKDTIMGITKPDIRRMARRGGVKRIQASIYEEIRGAIYARLSTILRDVCNLAEHNNSRTVTVGHVIYALKMRGSPIYGFDKGTYRDEIPRHRRRR